MIIHLRQFLIINSIKYKKCSSINDNIRMANSGGDCSISTVEILHTNNNHTLISD